MYVIATSCIESTGEPLWFNNALTEFKGANDDSYFVLEGWIGHNENWYGNGHDPRFPNELSLTRRVNLLVMMLKVFIELLGN